jgi:Zn-dependent protease/CBS domain-containing protein
MFGKPIRLFRIFGFQVGIDLSWFILFFLITWTLALGLFPYQFPGLPMATYALMGVIGALGLFASIVFHEMSHSLVARRFGLHMKGITLFLFGGVAEMPEEPKGAKAEFWMAIAGPLASVFLAAFFYGLYNAGLAAGWPETWNGIIGYLAIVNLILAIFNMVPAFPLDGGRILRSAVWAATGDFAKATRISSAVGSGFGLFLFIFGAVRILAGNLIGGVWWMLIGLFIRAGARSTVTQLTLSRLLAGETVRDFMNRHPITVRPELPVSALVDDYLYKHTAKAFPVTDGPRVLGCVGVEQVKALRRDRWETSRVEDVMGPCAEDTTVSGDVPVEQALKRMQESGQTSLMVVEGGMLQGVISTGDILHYLSTRAELEKARGREAPRPRPAEEPRRDRPGAGEPLPA